VLLELLGFHDHHCGRQHLADTVAARLLQPMGWLLRPLKLWVAERRGLCGGRPCAVK
jgi:hypothetical protein